MMIPREFDDANRRKKLERTPEQIQIANLKAEIKRLRDALKAKIDSYEYDTGLYEIQEGLEALLKEQDNE